MCYSTLPAPVSGLGIVLVIFSLAIVIGVGFEFGRGLVQYAQRRIWLWRTDPERIWLDKQVNGGDYLPDEKVGRMLDVCELTDEEMEEIEKQHGIYVLNGVDMGCGEPMAQIDDIGKGETNDTAEDRAYYAYAAGEGWDIPEVHS